MKNVVVTPTYNEVENIKKLVSAILELSQDIDVIIVDDNSRDGTGRIADNFAKETSRVSVIHRAGKMGLGSAYVEGFRLALSKGYDNIIQMDADLSHDPKYIPDFIEAIKSYDLVLGSRYTRGISVVNWGFKRLLLSKAANLYVRLVTGLKVSDYTGGFKCFKREVLESINLDAIHANGYSFIVETTYRTWKKGFKIGEVPIIFVDRSSGTSKLARKDVIEAFFIPWRLRLGLYRK